MSLKICIAIPAAPAASAPDDAQQACINLAETLAASGHDITLCIATGDGALKADKDSYARITASPAVRVVTLEWLTDVQVIAGWFRRRSFEFYRWLKSQTMAYDCVITPAWQGVAYYAVLARQQGIAFEKTQFVTYLNAPTQWRYHARPSMPVSVDALEVMFMERDMVRRADAAVVGTSGLREWLESTGWILPTNTSVLPPLPTTLATSGRSVEKPKAIAATSPGRATAEPLTELVFAGVMDSIDGVELFCQAVQILPVTLREKLQITFVGAIGEVGQLAGDWYIHKALRRSGCRYSILAEADLERQLAYLRHAGRIAVFTARGGRLSQLLVNCLAESMPILIPEDCGLRDFITPEGFAAISFPPNAQALSKTVQAVMQRGISTRQTPALVAHPAQHWERLIKSVVDGETPASANAGDQWAGGSVQTTGGAMPMISVCLVHYNRPETLRQAVDSLKAQSYRNYEVILVDDGSPSLEAQALLKTLDSEFAACRWRIIRQENQYMWRARNNAARQARGEYLAFMDDDNIAVPHWLTCAMQVAQRTHADVVTSTMTLFEGHAPPDPSVEFPMWVPLGAAASAGAFTNVFGDVHCLMKRSVFEKLGGFEERFSGYQEDWEFFARAVLAGYKLELIPESLLYYRISKTSVSRSADQSWNANRGCSMQPYLHAIGPELRDLIPLLLENQRLHSGMAAKRVVGRGKIVRRLNRWLRGRAADAPVVVQTTADAIRAAGAIPPRRRCPRR